MVGVAKAGRAFHVFRCHCASAVDLRIIAGPTALCLDNAKPRQFNSYRIGTGRVKALGAIYELSTGKVRISTAT